MAHPKGPKTTHSRAQSHTGSHRGPGGPGRPTPLSLLVEDVQAEAARLSGAAMTPSAWRAAVGARIAQRTRVGQLVRRTLTIYAASPAWANELSFLASDIVVKLRQTGLDVEQIRFRVRDLGPPPALPAQKATQARRPPVRTELPAALQERLALVDDPQLREAIAEAASLSLAAQRRSNR